MHTLTYPTQSHETPGAVWSARSDLSFMCSAVAAVDAAEAPRLWTVDGL